MTTTHPSPHASPHASLHARPDRVTAEQRVIAGAPTRLFLDGEWVDAEAGAAFDALDPGDR